MKKWLRKVLGIKAPLLEWRTQDAREYGGQVMTYAKSSIGTYEIYWQDDAVDMFLLSFPHKSPAVVGGSLFNAIQRAQEDYNSKYFTPRRDTTQL